MKKRLLASLLSATILLSMTPMAFADEETAGETPTTQAEESNEIVPGENKVVESGSCGATDSDQVSWSFDSSTGILTISGTGRMMDWKWHGKKYCGNESAQNADTTCEKTDCILSRPWQKYIDQITGVVIEDGVEYIGDYAFALTKVTTASFNKTTTDYGDYVYYNCDALTTVDWTNFAPTCVADGWVTNRTETGAAVPFALFDGCANLEYCKIGDTTYDRGVLVLPSNVDTICTAAFRSTAFSTIDFSDGLKDVKTIGPRAFEKMANLTSIIYPARIEFYGENNGAGSTFTGSGLRTVMIENGVKSILSGTFAACESLDTVSIGKDSELETIGYHSFRDTKINHLYFPSKVSKIGDQAFYYGKDGLISFASYDMTDVSNLTDVGKWAFTLWWSGCKHTEITRVFYTVDDKIPQLLSGSVQYEKGTAPRTEEVARVYAITNGGTFAADTAFEQGKLATPVKDGYKFGGWYENADCTGDKVTAPAANKTYYAKWETCTHAAKTYVASGNVITEKCADCGHVFGTATLTLPENLVYDGQAKVAAVTYSEGWTGEKNLTVTYDEAEIAPVDAGTYTVKITVGDAKVTQSMTIAQATPTITISADKETLTGGGDVVLTVITEPEEGTVDVSCDKDVDITLNKENGTFTATLPNSSEKYTFTATYVESTNYKTASDTCDVTVTYQSTSSGGGGGSRNNSYAVSTPKADNGSVTVNNGSTAKKGDTVTITVKPDEGYEIDKVTVTDSKGNSITVTDKGDGKFSFVMPDSKVDVKATFVKSEVKPDQPSKTAFVDVPENSWYADAADFVAQRGLMSGVGENLFGGGQNTTRAMLMTILARMDGQDVTGGATWYEKAMNWAKANGVSDGTMPEVNITREQLATMLYSYAKLKGIDTTQGGMAVREFSDYDSISDWAGQSMTWAVNAGILSGRGNNTLAPTAGATRAEMAVMLQQFVKLMEK